MQTPISPADQARRLDVLGAYDILDSSPDRTLDDLAALAAQVAQAPIAVISFVDERRESFKARVGLELDATPRESAFGAATIGARDTLIVRDARADSRFAANPLVAHAPHVRFYAGVPLRTLEGVAIGTVAVMDAVIRETPATLMPALEIVARQVMSHLDRRRQTLDLADSQSLLLNVYRNYPAALAITRWPERTFVDVNAAFTELLGWTRAEIVGKSAIELGMVDADASRQLRTQLADARVIRDYEMTLNTREGGIRRVLIGTELLDLRGEVHGVTTFVDITARKEVEIAASRLAAIVESSDDAIISTDLDAIITTWNKGAEHVFGYRASEVIGGPIARIIPAARADDETLIIGRISRGESVAHFETLRRTKDGRAIDVSITASPIRDFAGRVVGMSKIARDITARRRAEEARRESEARYRALFDYAPDGILIADAAGRYVDVNASVCRMLGYEREELIGLDASHIVTPAEREYITPALETIRGRLDYHREWIFRRKDGSTFPVEVIASMMPDGYILALIRDVTERNRIDARFRRLVDSNAQGVMFWGADGRLLGANDA
ncbi:MAG TPA: PAS domain S-box protein, partial [Gemmatimonadaceae bacterium]